LAYKRLFHIVGFNLVWLSTVFSLLGDSMGIVAVVSVMQRLSNYSSISMTVYHTVRDIVPLFFMLPSGLCADRYDQRKIMLISDMTRMIIVLGYLYYLVYPVEWMIYVILSIHVSMNSFFHPAMQSYIPKIVDKSMLTVANVLDSVTYSVTLMIGSGLGGLLLTFFSPYVNIALDSGSYLISAIFVSSLFCKSVKKSGPIDVEKSSDDHQETELSGHHPMDGPVDEERNSGLIEIEESSVRESVDFVEIPLDPVEDTTEINLGQCAVQKPTVRELFKYLKEHRDTVWLSLLKSIGNLSNGVIGVLSAKYAHERFQISNSFSLTISMAYLVEGFGCFMIPMIVRFMVKSTTAMRKSLLLSIGSMALGLLCVTFSYHIAVWFIGLFLFSFGNSMMYVFMTTIMQMENPQRYQGRLFAISYSMRTVSHALGAVISGTLLDYAGASSELICGVTAAMMVVIFVLWKAIYLRKWSRGNTEDNIRYEEIARNEYR